MTGPNVAGKSAADHLDEFRDNAAASLVELIGITTEDGNPQQIETAAKLSVTAQARYTLLCETAIKDTDRTTDVLNHLATGMKQ